MYRKYKKKAIGFRTCKRDKDCSSFSKPIKRSKSFFCSWKYNSNKKRRSTKYTNFVLPTINIILLILLNFVLLYINKAYTLQLVKALYKE